MEASVNVFSDLFDRIRAWIPHRPDTTSREFWMPDRICRKCYDCDAQFTIFNRRHHCRICGKVFCGLCSVNTIQVAVEGNNGVYEERDRVRVCNYCYKVSRQGSGDDILQPEPEPDSETPPMTPSSGNNDLADIEMNGGAAPLAMSQRTPTLFTAVSKMDDKTAKLRLLNGTLSNYDSISSVPGHDPPPSPPTTYGNRSDDEDEYFQREQDYDSGRYARLADLARLNGDEYEDESLVDLEDHRRSQSSKYSSQSSDASNVPAEDPDGSSRGARSRVKTADPGNITDSLQRPRIPAKQKSSNDMEVMDEDYTPFNEVYNMELQKPVDYENNALLWDPPLPEEDNGDLGTSMVDDDDDDEEEEGGWLPRSVGSMSSSEFKLREKAALRDLVDGHFRALVAKLLEGAGLEVPEEEEDPDSWLSIVTSLSLQAASLVKPDRGGGAMDPGNYVKVKCLASGNPRDSLVVKGVVCKKNVHNKRMTSRYKNPRILLLGGALEYQRVSNQLSSIETLLQQEQAHIKMTVDRIEQHHPNVLLVEKTVSGHAQELLLNKDISLVLNVKKRVMERIARCTGAQIFQSCESLMIPKAGQCGLCETFHVDKYVEEHGSAGCLGERRTKTLMFFEECPRPVGCTILLRGANGDVLKKVKAVVQYAVFAAYHLALETSFLADEGATLPDCSLNITVALPNNQVQFDRSISSVPGFTLPVPTHLRPADMRSNQIRTVVPNNMSVSPIPVGFPGTVPAGNMPSTVLPSTASSQISSAVNTPVSSPARTTIGFSSTIIRGQTPYSSSNGLISESLHGLKTLGGLSASLRQSPPENGHLSPAVTLISQVAGNSSEAIVSSLSNGGYNPSIVHETGRIGSEFLHASVNMLDQSPMWSGNGKVGDYGLVALERQSSQIDFVDNHLVEEQDSKEDFPPSPSDHQSILVSMSSRCLRKGTVCERPHIFRIKYYGTTDKPLGRYLRESLFDTSNCRSCEEPLDAHIHCFTHRQGSLTISVQRLTDRPPLPGEREGKIWMWHRCLLCPRVDGVPPATRRVVMSDAAWGLSFGKFLELSFSNHAAASRLAACGHSLHRDCLRFYGFGNAVACFRYAPIILNAVHVPPAKLDFSNCTRQEWLLQEINEIGEKGEKVFAEVFDTLRVFGEKIASSGSLCSGSKGAEARRRIVELEEKAQIHKADFEDALQTAAPLNPPPGKPIADVLELNRLRRVLLECAIYWDDLFNKLIANLRAKKSTSSEANLLDDSSIKLAKQTSFGGNSGKSLGSLDGEADSESSSGGLSRSDSKGATNGTKGPPTTEINGDAIAVHSTDVQVGVSQVPADIYAPSPPSVMARPDDPSPSVLDGPPVSSVSKVHGEHGEDSCNTTESVAIGEHSALAGHELIKAEAVSIMKSPVVGISSPLCDNSVEPLVLGDNGNGQPLSGDLLTKAAEDTLDAVPALGDGAARDESPPKQESEARTEKIGEVDTVPLKVVLGNIEQEKDGNEQEPALQSTPSSPTKVIAATMDREFSTPFLHLYRSNSRASSSLAGSPPRNEARRPIAQSTICKSAADGGARVLLPPGRDNIIVAIYDDEPTTIIAYALASEAYQKELNKDTEHSESKDGGMSHPLQPSEGAAEALDRSGSTRVGAAGDPLLHTEPMDVTTVFEDGNGSGKMKYSVRAFYAKQFDALRKKCCDGDLNFLRSLSRCRKWGAQGGKSNVFFAKTADDRFVVKQVTRTESVSFRDFGLEYFKYLSEYIDSGSPTCLAKILGLYQVTVKRAGKEIQKMDLLVMENLLYGRSLSRIYDLKGSVRSRYNDSKGSNAVLLDENLLEAMPTAPIFVGNKAKRLLERAVWNDTAFLATVQVMDYSLLVGIDEERQELAIGIIDFIRQYTWDKQLETWVKASGILGGPKNAAPTVISPKQYKKRFRKAMSTYFLMVPDQCWSPPPIISTPQLARSEDLGSGRFLQDDEIGEDSSKRL